MNTLDFFQLQCLTTEQMIAAQSLEMNLRCLRGEKGMAKALRRMERDFPSRAEQFNSDWFCSLVEAITPFYVKVEDTDNDDYENPFNAFIEAALCTLNDSTFALIGKLDPVPNRLDEKELAKPHMQWVGLFTARVEQLKADFPEQKRHWVRMSRIHPSLNISDDMALSLSIDYFDSDSMTSMTSMDYVNWYVKSRSNFVIENESLDPELKVQMTNTLHAWFKNDDRVASNVSWLSRNYEFHAKHEAFIIAFVEKVKSELTK